MKKIRPELQNSMPRKRRERLINKHHVQHELFAAATEWDGLSDRVRIDMLIYILGKNAVDIYDSFKLSGEDIQFANVKQKFEDDSLIQVYYHQFLKCGDIFSEYLKFPTKKMRVKCVKPPERQIQKSMRKQD